MSCDRCNSWHHTTAEHGAWTSRQAEAVRRALQRATLRGRKTTPTKPQQGDPQ